MNETTEIEKLAAALKTERPKTKIYFYEESDPDACSTLFVETQGSRLLVKLARLFGCLVKESHWTDCVRFEADDEWNGRGKVNLRDLADEFVDIKGECFSFSITVAELRLLARHRRFRRRAFVSADDLKQAVEEFLTAWKTDPKPVMCAEAFDSIVQKLSRCRQTFEKFRADCTRPRLRKNNGK
ncbi:MAG: hypothetical protein O2960_22975 [Verrucomicrobia bacterium]|nr:hypothetical protein [Verrucomicrobiota bacterium]